MRMASSFAIKIKIGTRHPHQSFSSLYWIEDQRMSIIYDFEHWMLENLSISRCQHLALVHGFEFSRSWTTLSIENIAFICSSKGGKQNGTSSWCPFGISASLSVAAPNQPVLRCLSRSKFGYLEFFCKTTILSKECSGMIELFYKNVPEWL
jgi:hypothetical protein